MERKIGDVFTFDGEQVEVIEGNCWDCYFLGKLCFDDNILYIRGVCSDDRKDKDKDICYKLIEE